MRNYTDIKDRISHLALPRLEIDEGLLLYRNKGNFSNH